MFEYDDNEDRQLTPPFGEQPGGQMMPPFGPSFGPPFGQPPGQQMMPPFGPPFGQPFGPPSGPPFGPPFGQPPGQQITPPFGPPFGQPPGTSMGPPTTPPPSFIPQQAQAQGVGIFAVDPGAIRPCIFRFVYIWLDTGVQFWAWLVFVGPRSIAGWRWTGFRWVYFGVDINRIVSFVCF